MEKSFQSLFESLSGLLSPGPSTGIFRNLACIFSTLRCKYEHFYRDCVGITFIDQPIDLRLKDDIAALSNCFFDIHRAAKRADATADAIDDIKLLRGIISDALKQYHVVFAGMQQRLESPRQHDRRIRLEVCSEFFLEFLLQACFFVYFRHTAEDFLNEVRRDLLTQTIRINKKFVSPSCLSETWPRLDSLFSDLVDFVDSLLFFDSLNERSCPGICSLALWSLEASWLSRRFEGSGILQVSYDMALLLVRSLNMSIESSEQARTIETERSLLQYCVEVCNLVKSGEIEVNLLELLDSDRCFLHSLQRLGKDTFLRKLTDLDEKLRLCNELSKPSKHAVGKLQPGSLDSELSLIQDLMANFVLKDLAKCAILSSSEYLKSELRVVWLYDDLT
jgi:hypothetical protein